MGYPWREVHGIPLNEYQGSHRSRKYRPLATASVPDNHNNGTNNQKGPAIYGFKELIC